MQKNRPPNRPIKVPDGPTEMRARVLRSVARMIASAYLCGSMVEEQTSSTTSTAHTERPYVKEGNQDDDAKANN